MTSCSAPWLLSAATGKTIIFLHTILSLCWLPQSEIMFHVEVIFTRPPELMGVFGLYFRNHWVVFQKKPHLKQPHSPELLFCKNLSCAWLNLSLPQSASKGPLRKCLPEVKRAPGFPGEKVSRENWSSSGAVRGLFVRKVWWPSWRKRTPQPPQC